MTVRELGGLLRARKLSCLELIEQTFSDIRARDSFGCFITLMENEAHERAKVLDAELASGKDRGPFHGIPIAHKDLFYTRGVRTTGGSLVFRDFVPQYDATVVERLNAAGAITVGKTNQHELAYGITSQNPHYGAVLNPLDTNRIPGGSSGGSAAAIAAGFLPMALGTDTGGSIRIPASYCGITGLKPTYGRVSRFGVLPLASSLDHVGPLGFTVEDCALAMNVIAGPDRRDASCARREAPEFNLPPLSDLKGLRAGLPRNFFFDRVDAEVADAVHKSARALQQLGAQIAEIEIPDLDQANVVARMVQLPEVAAVYAQYTDPAQFGSDVWALLEQGRMISGYEYVNAQRMRTLFRRQFDEVWKSVDVLLCPATPVTAPLRNQRTVRINGHEEDTRMASTRLVRAVNLLGEPALSMPCGVSRTGLPIGLQMIGSPFSEPRLLQVARMLEGCRD